MGKNGSVVVLMFLLMIVLGQSNAFNSRRLVAIPDPIGSSDANQDSPSSSPPPDDKKSDHPSVEVPKSNDSPNTSTSNVESKGLNDANTAESAKNSSDLDLNQGKNQDGKESKTFARQSCKGLPTCSDQEKTMTACIQDFVNGSNNLSLVVQNEKSADLKVNITFGASVNNNLPTFEIPAHGTKEVNFTLSGDKSNKVILNAGNGDCELQIGQPPLVNSPSKSKDPQNTSNLKDDPAKPKDDNDPVESPTKPKEENIPPTDKKGNSPSNSKGVDTPSKSKDVNELPKPKDVDDPSKSIDLDDPLKTKDNDDPSKSKSKDNDDPSKSKSKDNDDPSKSKSKDEDDLSKSKSKDDNDPSKSKSKDDNDPSKPKDTGPPFNPKTNVDTPIPQNNFLDQLTFYSKQVRPIYGAYIAFLVALMIGVSWAFCTFKKRRSGNGVPYQELEMGPTEPSNAVDVETAEGWEHDWDDDDWDEDKAIRSPGGGVQTKSISSNGLTSRATRKDDWDADWDD